MNALLTLLSRTPNYCIIALISAVFFATNTHAFNGDFTKIAAPAELAFHPSEGTLEIHTSDNHWTLILKEHSVLGGSASIQQALFEIPFFYRGKVHGAEDSWVRLDSESDLTNFSETSLNTASLEGHVFVNGSLYELNFNPSSGYSITSIASDDSNALLLSSRNISTNASISPFAERASGPELHKAIRIGIVVDSRYNEHHNGRGLAEALSIINGADGLFQDQLGLAIIVERFKVLDNPASDPLREFSGNMEEILRFFRLTRIEDEELSADLALVHLFTGHSDSSQLIGLSWIGTVCQQDGHDVSVSTPFPYSMLLSSHEIAHNLGAVHDNDQQCLVDESITGNEVMWSELSHNTQANFSSCSIETMSASLSSSCVVDNQDLSVSLESIATDFLFEQQVQITATNWDTSRVARETSSVTQFPDNTILISPSAGCAASGSTLTCQHENLNANSSSSVSVTAQFTNSDPAVIQSELLHPVFTDTNSLDNNAAVQVNFNGQAFSANAFAANDDSENQAVITGGSAGAGSLGPLSLWLLMLLSAPLITCRRYAA